MESEVEDAEAQTLEQTDSKIEAVSEGEDPRSPEDIEAAEIERVFGPVDKKQEDVEQVWVFIIYTNLFFYFTQWKLFFAIY